VISATPAEAVPTQSPGPISERALAAGGAALIVDYVLTVAVSIAAGVGSLTSAFRPLGPYTLPICLAMLAVITFLNLRGLAEGPEPSWCPLWRSSPRS